MRRRPPRSTRTDTLFPYTTLFRALVSNLDEDLAGNGERLNQAIGSLSDLVSTFADNDDVLLRIVDSFDRLSATLVTREQQLGEVLDAFADASQVLADERESIESLVRSEERRVGKECVSTCRSRWSPAH